MISIEAYKQATHQAVVDTAQAYHLKTTTNSGLQLAVPCSYQILEPGFRPFRSGKASAEELQRQLDDVCDQARASSIDLGLESAESVRKLSIQLGLGIDCSNFAFRALSLIHDRLELGPYTDYVFLHGPDIKYLHSAKESWSAKNDDGSPRQLEDEEQQKLQESELLDTTWVAQTFSKDPEFIIGSQHISGSNAARIISPNEALPGDLIAFKKAGKAVVSHVAVIESVNVSNTDLTQIDFWHSWHSRDFESGLRRDSVTVNGSTCKWSQEGLSDQTRYKEHYLCRPIGLASIIENLRQQPSASPQLT